MRCLVAELPKRCSGSAVPYRIPMGVPPLVGGVARPTQWQRANPLSTPLTCFLYFQSSTPRLAPAEIGPWTSVGHLQQGDWSVSMSSVHVTLRPGVGACLERDHGARRERSGSGRATSALAHLAVPARTPGTALVGPVPRATRRRPRSLRWPCRMAAAASRAGLRTRGVW